MLAANIKDVDKEMLCLPNNCGNREILQIFGSQPVQLQSRILCFDHQGP